MFGLSADKEKVIFRVGLQVGLSSIQPVSAGNPCRLSISWTSQDIDSYENNTKYLIKTIKCCKRPACR